MIFLLYLPPPKPLRPRPRRPRSPAPIFRLILWHLLIRIRTWSSFPLFPFIAWFPPASVIVIATTFPVIVAMAMRVSAAATTTTATAGCNPLILIRLRIGVGIG